jgi:hypothetical protein
MKTLRISWPPGTRNKGGPEGCRSREEKPKSNQNRRAENTRQQYRGQAGLRLYSVLFGNPNAVRCLGSSIVLPDAQGAQDSQGATSRSQGTFGSEGHLREAQAAKEGS